MLILTRKQKESIIIGDSIEIVVTRVSGNKVRIGVAAPRNIPVYRNEIGPLFGLGHEQVSVRRHSLCSV
jgi:carbon storage regulator CsrA